METYIDCHYHMWDLATNYYPWLTDRTPGHFVGDHMALRRNYLVEDLRNDIGDLPVVAAIHVQAEHDYADHVRETRWLQGVADAGTMPQAIIANVDLQADNARDVIEGHMAFANMRGIRQMLYRRMNPEASLDPLNDPIWHRNFALLEEYDLLCEVQFHLEQAAALLEVIRDHPKVRFVFPHLALPPWHDAIRAELWRVYVGQFAEQPNVVAKLSGYGLYGADWTLDAVRPFALHVIAAFGQDRLVCGSNYPVERLTGASYRRTWEVHSALLDDAGYDQDQRTKVLGGNARRLYRLRC